MAMVITGIKVEPSQPAGWSTRDGPQSQKIKSIYKSFLDVSKNWWIFEHPTVMWVANVDSTKPLEKLEWSPAVPPKQAKMIINKDWKHPWNPSPANSSSKNISGHFCCKLFVLSWYWCQAIFHRDFMQWTLAERGWQFYLWIDVEDSKSLAGQL